MTAASADANAFGEPDHIAMIRETARDIAAKYDDAYWRGVNAGDHEPTEFWDDCARAGFLGTTVPEKYGGEGMGMRELVAITEELAAHGCFGVGMLFVVTVVFGAITLTENGSDAQKEALLPALVDGNLHFCMALTEPTAGHNAPELDTFAEPTDDGFIVNGTKQWISGVGRADKMLLVARTTPKDAVEERTHGLSLLLADPSAPSVELTELDTGIPTPERQYEIRFDDYHLPDDAVIGQQDRGLHHLFETVNPERLVGAASAVGAGRNALSRAVDYATDREVFDAPIGSHQAIQHPIAEAYSHIEAAALLVRKAAWLLDTDQDAAVATNMAKLRASQAGHEAADVAVQTHGGNGFSREYMVIELWKASRLGLVAPGSNEMMRNHIAERGLGLPRSY